MRTRFKLMALAAVVLMAPPARADDTADVRAVLQRFDKAYESLDAAGIAALFAPESEAVFFSFDVGDRWTGIPAIKVGLSADMRRVKSVKIEGQPAAVHVRGSLAWFERLMVMNVVVREGESSIFARATGVLEKRGSQWFLLQLHISVGAPRDSAPRD